MSKKQAIDFKQAIPRSNSDLTDLLSSFQQIHPAQNYKDKVDQEQQQIQDDSICSATFNKPIKSILFSFSVSRNLIRILRSPKISHGKINDQDINQIRKILQFIKTKYKLGQQDEHIALHLHLFLSTIQNINDITNLSEKNNEYPELSSDHNLLNSINSLSIYNRLKIIQKQQICHSQATVQSNFAQLMIAITEQNQINYFQNNTLYVSKNCVLKSIQSKGYLDPHFAAFIVDKLPKSAITKYFIYHKSQTTIKYFKIQKQYARQYPIILAQMQIGSEEDYQKWYHQQLASLLNSTFTIQNLKTKISNRHTNYWIEKFLIGLQGWNQSMASEATVLLNSYYDQTDWQISTPFNPIISQVDQKFQINYLIDAKENRQKYFLNICIKAPCMDQAYPGDVFSWHCPEVHQFKSDDDKYFSIQQSFGNFMRTGFYDWKLFQMGKQGRNTHVHKIVSNNKKILSSEKKIHDVKPVQGRFIVHPRNTRKLQIHEIYMDSLTVNQGSHKVPKFQDAYEDIKKYSNYGINCVYLMGVFERDNGKFQGGFKRPQASPIALTSRKKPCEMLGGEKQFKKLMKQSNSIGMKIITDCTARVSSSRYRKVYQPYLLSYIDDSGKKYPFYGAQGRSINHQDTAILNYRKIQAWNLLIEEVIEVVQNYGISGIYLDNGSSWPNIYEINKQQMFRKDQDGEECYSNTDKFQGLIVNKNKLSGYWISSKQNQYPNPFFIKMAKQLWNKYQNFHIVCESFEKIDKDQKNISAIVSGLIPRTFKLPKAIAQIVGINLHENGSMNKVTPKNIVNFKKWYEEIQKYLPRNSIIIQSTSSHAWPYPAFLFKKATWAFIDLLFFLPEIPMTFMGEHDGKAFRSKATSIFFQNHQNKLTSNRLYMKKTNSSFFNGEISNSSEHLNSSVNASIRDPAQIKYLQENFRRQVGPEFGFDLKQIHKHYEHRRRIRNQVQLLTSGKMISLSAEHKYGVHKNVLSFAKYNTQQILLISINFNESKVDMHYNLNNLKYLFTKAYQSNLVVKLQSILGQTKIQGTYYTISQLILSKIQCALNAYQSMIWKITIQTNVDPQIAYKCSIQRMKGNLLADPPKWIYSSVFTNQLSYMLDSCKSLKSFMLNLQFLYKKFILPQNLNFNLVISKAYQFWLNKTKLSKIFGIFKLIDKFPEFNQTLKKTVKAMIEGNTLGPIAFVTPQIGQWSTVGGLGVMVDQLSKQLAKLGQQVYIVTPYYQYNKKGQTGYLTKYGFKYERNVKVWSAHISQQFGVHIGKYKGVNFVWLHNPQLFSKPYAGQSAFYVTKQLVFFALATSETFCQLKIFPSITVTNDWMCGFVSAYVKVGKYGQVFNGTKFMHICHNLDPLYEGRLYPKHQEGDLNWLIQLPTQWYLQYRSNKTVINPSKCALQACDNWGTVSNSYKFDLLKQSPLAHVLWKYPHPFSFPNGVRKEQRVGLLLTKTPGTHNQSKTQLRNKYFKDTPHDPSIPILAFIGRITRQKGVHMILESIQTILYQYNFKVQFIVGGPADVRQQYGKYCADKMLSLNKRYPKCFWSDPYSFFYDGPLCNIGSDYALMPSLFEPGGIVQHQFFCGSTPVIAFKTGGLKDTVFQYDPKTKKGNGFNFMSYELQDFKNCLRRAINLYKNDKASYEKLRSNAYESVVQEQDVAKGWNTEFYRLQNKVYIDWITVQKQIQALKEKDEEINNQIQIGKIGQKGEFWSQQWQIKRQFKNVLQSCQKLKAKQVTFTYQTQKIPRPRQVCICGSWDQWKTQKKMIYQPVKKNWKIQFKVQPGTYNYKYIVQNQWVLNPSQEIQTDINNIENHIIVIE